MKKTLISGIFITILGVILLGLGFLHHGAHSLIWQNGGFEIEKATMKHTSFKNVKNLKIDTSDEVQIKSYDGDKVKVAYRATNVPSYTSKNHQLAISGNSHEKVTLSLGFEDFTVAPIVIYVPHTSRFEKLICSTDDSISISNLSFNQLHLTSNEDVNLNHVNVKDELQVDGYSDLELGDVSAASLDFETSDGDITVK